MRKRRDEKILQAVRANVGIQAAYRRKLDNLVRSMHKSFCYWIAAAYKANPPEMAMDEATAASQLRIAINKLVRQWQRRFDQASMDLAKYFATAANKRSDAVLREILKKGGWTVRFVITPEMRDVMKAAIAENVSLIRSIPQQYLTNVAGDVYRSVQAGRDLGTLTKQLEKQYGVTRRRAALIARDQNQKMTTMFQRVRQTELGIAEAIWVHSGGGKTQRRTHVAQSGKRYNIETGFWDSDEKAYCWPGSLINCRCVSRPVIRGFS